MEKLFQYEREKGMPAIYSLVAPFFHPRLPLIGLNYTPVAHNTLFQHRNGWTVPLRLCRGIIFDKNGDLIALSFPKFFNYGEHEETTELPWYSFTVMEKMDGHLGIIFKYKGEYLITTRGSFTSNTSKIAMKMLADYDYAEHWLFGWPENTTILVEIIHPATKVLTDYGGNQDFTLIGAFNTKEFIDHNYADLVEFGKILLLRPAEVFEVKSAEELKKIIKDRTVKNKEGYVARFAGGLRVKFKFETYLSKMIEAKLNYCYLMKKFSSGKLGNTMELLDEEIIGNAKQMLGEIMVALSVPGAARDKWKRLYNLVPPEENTSYYQSICRQFVKDLLALSAKK